MSKFCMKCEAMLEDDAVFCDECGARQENQVSDIQTMQGHKNNGAAEAEGRKSSGFGIASFICGLLSIFTFGALCVPEIIGIVFGVMAIRDKLRKHGLAVAGLIMSMIGTAMFILWIFI